MWRSMLAILLFPLVAAGCTTPADRTDTAAPDPSPSTATQPLASPATLCGTQLTGRSVRFPATDGTRLHGAIVGDGRIGVVLAHQYPGSMCDWAGFARHLAAGDHSVLLFDFRCFGDSPCPDGAEDRLIDDVAGAVALLRRHGAGQVFLVGASMGGAAVMAAAPTIDPRVAGVVSLSGERDLGAFIPSLAIDAGAAIDHLTSPLLIVTAEGDRYLPVADARYLHDHASSTDKELIVLPPGSGHGLQLIDTEAPPGQPDVTERILRFISTNTTR